MRCLLGIGRWLAVNGEAIYDTHSWVKFSDSGKQNIFFTVKADVLYAILVGPSFRAAISFGQIITSAAL